MTCQHCRRFDRRAFLGLLGLGVASVVAGCDMRPHRVAANTSQPPTTPASTSTTTSSTTTTTTPSTTTATTATTTTTSTTTTPPPTTTPTTIPPPTAGPPQVVYQGPPAAIQARQVAITIDDGYCAECAQAYVALAQTTGIHITFNPNGSYGYIWTPLAETLKPLIEAGQVQIGNHTFNHPWLTKLSDNQIVAELEQNEEWIQRTYGITGRPWWRPPYGAHDQRTDSLAASLGYTNVLLWNGTYGDATLETPEVLLAQAAQYFKPGAVMLGHANYPTVTHLFDQIAEIIASRDLHPVTLDGMFGTSRSTGRST